MTTPFTDSSTVGAMAAPTFPANKVIVLGMLDTMLVPDPQAKRDRESGRRQMVEITRKEARNRGS